MNRVFVAASLPGLSGMRFTTAAVVVVAALTAACGDLSQEDLLFRAGVPGKAALAVAPPGIEDEVAAELDDETAAQALTSSSSSSSQGLDEECGDGQLLCLARNLARGFNGATFFLLDLVDAISALPPTVREPGRRVWGPHYEARTNRSHRFEMVRTAEGFTFCLHAATGDVAISDATNAIGCGDDTGDTVDDEADVGGGRLLLIFSGTFAPSAIAGDAARFGVGSMHLEMGRLARFDRGPVQARAADFVFDNTGGGTIIDIDLRGTRINGEQRDGRYHYDRSTLGDGSLEFEAYDELVQPQPPLFGEQQLERVSIFADWNADRAGRASGVVDGGNARQAYELQECWDGALNTVYTRGIFGGETGDEAQCVDVDADAAE